MEAAKAALTKASNPTGSTNQGFLRKDANLYIVWVSDEDDRQPGTPTPVTEHLTDYTGISFSKRVASLNPPASQTLGRL